MAIYVQSCGVSQDNDYRWLKIRENTHIPETPAILKRPFPGVAGTTVRVTDMIDSKTPSIVLARSDGELLLYVTGLKAKDERADLYGRPVRNSVAWTFQDSDDNERVIRSLAVRALKGELESVIDEAVNVGGEYGFEVSLKKISQLAQPEKIESLEAESPIRIGKNSLEFKEQLALELERHCLLKEEPHRLLVVVTGIKTEDALLRARVWRGLSARVTAQEWIEKPDETLGLAPVTTRTGQNQPKENVFFSGIAIAVVILILIIVLAVKLLIPLKSEPETTPSPSQVIPQMNLPPHQSSQEPIMESSSTEYSVFLEKKST